MQVAETTVRKTITVNGPVEHAFEVFTAGFDTWWPRSHSTTKAPLDKAIVEPRSGGRLYQVATDGSEADWGRVLVWDPPTHLVLAWQLNADWQYDPDMQKASEVDIRFMPDGDGRTRVELEHRHFDRHGARAEEIRKAVDAPDGWSGLLKLFAAAVERG